MTDNSHVRSGQGSVPEPAPPAPPGPERDRPDPIPDIALIDLGAIPKALAAGWRDFLRAPVFGLFFSAFYVAGGLVLSAVAAAAGQEWWLMPFIVGFPLIAPFAAVGLYEVSRRLECGEPLEWGAILGVVLAQRKRQLPSMAMVVLLMFMFWVFVAHTIFALFMGVSALTNITSSPELILQGRGLWMLLVGGAIGAGFAAALFSLTVISLPLLLEREVDFISAMIASMGAVRENLATMMVWGLVIAILLFAGIAPLFLGLFLVLPVLGHASWHMYRQFVPDRI